MVESGFIDGILKEGLSKVESYRKFFPDKAEGKEDVEIERLADKELKKKDNEKYFNARAEEIAAIELDKEKWNLEKSTKELQWIYNEAKARAKKQDKWNVATIQSLLQPIVELDKIHGLQEIKVDVKMRSINIVGLDGLKKLDSDGNIIDTEFKEVKDD